MFVGLHATYSSLSDFNVSFIFSTDFRKKTQISNLMKIRPVAARLFHGRTDRHDELTDSFRNFAKRA